MPDQSLPEDVHPNHTPQHTLLTSPTQIALFHLLQIKYSLKIEIRTGLRHSRGSVLKLANEVFKANDLPVQRTKQAAFDQISAHIDSITADLVDDPA